MNSGTRAVLLVALVLVSGVGGLFVGPAVADGTATLLPRDDGSGNATIHNVSIPVDSSTSKETGSLNEIVVDYNNSSGYAVDLTGFDKNTVVSVGIDTDGDGVIEKDASNDMESPVVSENGTRVSIGFGGSFSLNQGDDVILRYNATNPKYEGTYDFTADLNTGSVVSPETGSFTISDATAPAIENFTLTKTGQDVDLVVETDDQLSALDVTVSDDASKTLNLSAFNESGSGTDWTYVADVSNGEDGDYTATLDNAVDDAGNAVDNPSASDSLTVNTLAIAIDNGTVTPDAVDSGETVGQTVTVGVSQASVDGQSETVSITFNGSVDVANATATADSATVTDTTVTDGNTTVVATVDSGDGGGTAAYNVTYDLNATYTAAGNTTVPIDATADDSDGDSASVGNVSSVYVRDATPPVISNFTLTATGQDVDLTFDASEELGSATVQLGDDAAGTLTLSELNATADGDGWHYRGDVSEGIDGTFSASLGAGDAADLAGNTNQESHANTTTVNELPIDVVNATVTNDTVDPTSTVDQTVAVDVQDVSLDGGEDTVQVVFPAAAEVSLNGVSSATTVNNSSVSTTSAGETVLNATVNPGDGGGVTDVTVSYDVTVTYPDSAEGETLPVDASAFDSDGDTDTETNLTHVRVRDTVPEITNTTLTAVGQDVDLQFNSTEELATAQATFENDLATTFALDNSSLSGTQNADGTWTYNLDASEGVDGQFNVTVSGADAAGNTATGNRTDSLRVNETDPVVVNATVSPRDVQPAETTIQTVTADVDGFSRESGVDTVLVTLGDGTDITDVTNVSVTDENGDEASVSGYTVVDDGDGTNETVRVDIASGDGLGTANVSVSFDATIEYADALEGSTLPVNATAHDSDGASDSATNLTQVRVVDTYPTITNFTLDATGQNVDLTFDSSEALETVSVDVTRDGQSTTTLSRSNFTETYANGTWTYTADASEGTDGSFSATLGAGAALDNAANANQNSHNDSVTVDTRAIDVVAANATPDVVDPQTTERTGLTVAVHNVSLDGGEDTVRATLPNGTTATLHGASSDVGSVTSVTNDNGTLIATVATGSSGGVTAVNVSYNVSVTYPDALEGDTLAVNASATDSDGNEDRETNLTQVRVRDTHPTVTNFTLVNSTRDVDLTFNSSEELEGITVTVDGDTTKTLSRSNFTESVANGNWTYRADVSEARDGTFNATLAAGDAVDAAGNANNQSHFDSITVDTRAVTLVNATATPDAVDPDTTVEQTLTVSATDFGQDGGTDTLTLELNDSLNLSGVAGASVTSGEAAVIGTELLDADGDGAAEHVRLSLDTGDTGGTTDVTVSLNATVHYPESTEEETLPIDASATDSDGDTDAATNLTAVSVRGAAPTISNVTLNATGQDVDLRFDSDEQLADVQVDLSGDLNGTLTESDLTATGSGDDWTYTANVSDGRDGSFEATLTTATDDTGNDGAAGQSDSVRVNLVGPDLRQTRITPANVTPGEPVNQTLTTNVTGLSRDGLNDTVTIGFPNESAIALENVTVSGDNATVANATVNGTDVLVNVSSGNTTGTANVTLTTNVTATYDNATEGETLNLTAAVNDSDGESVGPLNVTQVNVTDTVPNVTQFALNATGQDVNLTVATNESVSTLNASLGGDLNETLTRENFTETYANGSYVYTANASQDDDGLFNATLTNATDPYNNSALVGQNDSVVVDTLNVSVDDLNATPETVRPNETAEQTVVLNATNVSQDGLNDTATFTFGNGTDVLNASATVNGTAAPTNVSDLDADGFNESVEVVLNDTDDLGTANQSIVLNATTSSNGSLEGENVTIDAAINDSDGSNASTFTNVSVVDTVPNVTQFALNATGQDVNLTVETNESVALLNASLGGDLNETLTRENFTETYANGSYVYTANVSEDDDGLFNATLTNATDTANNSALVGQNDSVVVDTLNVSVDDLNATPDEVTPNETTDQTLVLNATNVSQDGLNDTATFTFENGTDVLAANASVNDTTAATNVSDLDADGFNETVAVVLNDTDDLGTANQSIVLNVTTYYNGSLEGENVTIDGAVYDSDGSNASAFTNVSVVNTTPEITAFNLSAVGQDVNLTLAANESLAAVNVTVGGDLNDTVTRENFTESYENGSYVYAANVSEGLDGTFNASLENASDAAGNAAVLNGTVDANGSVTVDRTNASFADNATSAAPDTVDPNETVSQTLTVNVTGLSQDGENDTVVLSLNGTDVVDATATADGANATAAAVDADADNATDEVEVTLATGDDAGTANVTLTVDATVHYPDELEGTSVDVNATVEDSDGSNATVTGASAVSVRNTVPNVTAFDVALIDSNVTLAFATDERLETVDVALNGTVAGTLTRADFVETVENGSFVYTTTLAEGDQGRYNATLSTAADAAGNDGAANQTDEVSYWTGGGGQQQQPGNGGTSEEQPTPEQPSTSPTVTIEQTSAGERVVLKNGLVGLSVTGHVTADTVESDAGVHLSDIRYTATENGTVSLAATHDTTGAGLPSLPNATSAAMFYHVEADGVADTRYTFRVHKDRLGDRSPDEVTLFGTDGEEWTALNATYAGERGGFHTYSVRDDATTLAVGLSGANVSVVDATVAGETVNASEDPANVTRESTMTFVNVTVENTGPVAGEITLNVTADGSTIATRTVSVEANSTRTVQVGGDVAAVDTSPPVTVIEVNSVEAGVLPGPEQMDGDGSGTSTDAPGFGAVAALVALAAVALLARRD